MRGKRAKMLRVILMRSWHDIEMDFKRRRKPLAPFKRTYRKLKKIWTQSTPTEQRGFLKENVSYLS